MKHFKPDSIRIIHEGTQVMATSPEEMAGYAGMSFDISGRVPNASGKAFDFHSWYKAWRTNNGISDSMPMPSHIMVEAADSFEAVIPWEQLDSAVFLFAAPEGGGLSKGGPIRLYVPNGTSDCLNVKSVVVIRFIHDASRDSEATYGFKNVFTPNELLKKQS